MSGHRLGLRVLRASVVAVLLVIVVAPFLGFALNAFSYRWFYPQLVPRTWSLEAWRAILSTRSRVPLAALNSVVIAVGVTFVSVLLGLPAARGLGVHRFRGAGAMRLALLSPTMVSPLAIGMGLSVTFMRLNLGGTYLGVGLAHLIPVLPYVLLSLTGIFANYNPAHEEQARTLGARRVRVFFRVTLPAIAPGVVVASLFAFLTSWSQYVLTLLIGGGRIITLPVLLFSVIPGGNNGAIATQALLFIAPCLLVLAATSRFLTGSPETMRGFGKL